MSQFAHDPVFWKNGHTVPKGLGAPLAAAFGLALGLALGAPFLPPPLPPLPPPLAARVLSPRFAASACFRSSLSRARAAFRTVPVLPEVEADLACCTALSATLAPPALAAALGCR